MFCEKHILIAYNDNILWNNLIWFDNQCDDIIQKLYYMLKVCHDTQINANIWWFTTYRDMNAACMLCFVWKCVIKSSTVGKTPMVRWFKHMLHPKFNGRVASTCIKAARKMSTIFADWRVFCASIEELSKNNRNLNNCIFCEKNLAERWIKTKNYPECFVQQMLIPAKWNEMLKLIEIEWLFFCDLWESFHHYSYIQLVKSVEILV